MGNARAETAKLRIHGADKDLLVTIYDLNASGKLVYGPEKPVAGSSVVDSGVDVVTTNFDGAKQCYVRTVEIDNSTKPSTKHEGTQHEKAGADCLIYLGLPSALKSH